MSLFQRQRRAETDLDMWERLMRRFAELESRMDRLEVGWKDTRDQVKRSYQRLEKAAQRAESSSREEEPTPPELELPLTGPAKQEQLARLFNGRG